MNSAAGVRRITVIASSALLAVLIGAAFTGQAGAGDAPPCPPVCPWPPQTTCQSVPVTIDGTSGNDTIQGTTGDDVIAGHGGNDNINSGPGDDVICGGAGSDDLLGGSGSDTVLGGRDGDGVFAGSDNDESRGGRGPDDITDGVGHDFIAGGPDNDNIDAEDPGAKRGTPAADSVHCGQGTADSANGNSNDHYSDCEIVNGSP
jgi:Ca2+-binding RTX toxin-like protein